MVYADLSELIRSDQLYFYTRFTGEPKRATWVASVVEAHGRRLPQPGVWGLAGLSALIFDPHTLGLLEPHLSASGELLPVQRRDTGQEFQLLNVTRLVSCIDPKFSVLGPVDWRLSFREADLPARGLFRISENGVAHILYVEPDGDTDSLRERVRRHELTGLEFQPIWSSEKGPNWFSMFRS
jgi:hypothetical protein